MIPPFNSEELESKFEKIETKINGYNNKQFGKCVSFNTPRLKSTRRKMGIPNPANYYLLCKEIAINWASINSIINKSKISISKPKLDENDARYIKTENQYSELIVKKVLCSMSSKYMVYADVSRFHGTIYTHSIPWALHGKYNAKVDSSDALYGNKIDRYFRNLQDRQTLGIPTGPVCSYLISEVIACRIDEILRKRLSKSIKMLRFVDDFYFFCDSLNETELVMSTLAKALSEFELEINPEKTVVQNLPIEFEPIWISELRLYNFGSSGKKQE